MTDVTGPGRVLVVCTGNICRSPLLERVLQRALDRRWGTGGYQVRSAGTHGLEGHPMDERAASVLRALGGTPSGFVARRLRPAMVAEADLVLTATTAHRGLVVRAHPLALRYAFTFREFAALADTLDDDQLPGPEGPPSGRLRDLAATLVTRRGPGVVDDADIVDPFRREDAVYQQMDAQVRVALPGVLRALT
ncbi:low molecular weight phosphatase family protein [Ornithinimicrobium ciconiae]|uniref:Low molecular weight phosphatase family protein n=1 Tax=Ornithinimicrobium ciconiae TaxID=2594265 RepID=A0A516GDV1_9MICO|nr:low molecular weight phosphatase family protein [Ornithinimicrobium ciconiae]QDO89696.1 low molecular weight phosphatase family protein [Ornithinimicrobium ciconiae]